MIASNVDPFTAADLDTNRNGRLSDTQRKRLQGLARAGRKDEFILAVVAAGAAVALLAAPGLSLSVYVRLAAGAILLVVAVILLRTAIGGDSLTKDLRSGRVDRVEGAIGRDTRQQQGEHYMHTLYYLNVAGQTYEVDSTTYNAAPDAGIVSLYVLPRSRAIVNLERMPDRPLPAGVTTSPTAVIGVAMAALNPFDSVKSAEARAEIAAIGNAMQAQMAGAATPPPASQRDPRPLAEAILEGRERPVRSARKRRRRLGAALRVEAPHERRVGGKALGRGDPFHRLAVPQPARTAEGGEARLGGDARTRHDQDAGVLVDARALRGPLPRRHRFAFARRWPPVWRSGPRPVGSQPGQPIPRPGPSRS